MNPQPQPADDDLVYRAFKPYVTAVVRSVQGGAYELEDLVQDVFVAVLAGRRSLRDPAALRAWVRAVAVHVTRASIRRRRARRRVEDTARREELVGLTVSDRCPERALALREALVTLVAMPADLRFVWWMRCVEDAPLAEVAERSGCSCATAKRRVAQARGALATVP